MHLHTKFPVVKLEEILYQIHRGIGFLSSREETVTTCNVFFLSMVLTRLQDGPNVVGCDVMNRGENQAK